MKFAAVVAALAAVLLTAAPPLPAGQICSMSLDGVCRCHHDEGAAPCCEIVPEYPRELGITVPVINVAGIDLFCNVPIIQRHPARPETCRRVGARLLPPRHGPPLFLEIESLLI